MQSPIELVVFLQAYVFSTLKLSSGLFRPVFLVPSSIAMQALQKWIDDNVDVNADYCTVVPSKPLLDAMRNAVPGLKSAQYGNHLRTIGAVCDQMHILGTRAVGMYREIVWKTQPVDNRDDNKRAKMEASLDKFFDCTGSATNWVKKNLPWTMLRNTSVPEEATPVSFWNAKASKRVRREVSKFTMG